MARVGTPPVRRDSEPGDAGSAAEPILEHLFLPVAVPLAHVHPDAGSIACARPHPDAGSSAYPRPHPEAATQSFASAHPDARADTSRQRRADTSRQRRADTSMRGSCQSVARQLLIGSVRRSFGRAGDPAGETGVALDVSHRPTGTRRPAPHRLQWATPPVFKDASVATGNGARRVPVASAPGRAPFPRATSEAGPAAVAAAGRKPGTTDPNPRGRTRKADRRADALGASRCPA